MTLCKDVSMLGSCLSRSRHYSRHYQKVGKLSAETTATLCLFCVVVSLLCGVQSASINNVSSDKTSGSKFPTMTTAPMSTTTRRDRRSMASTSRGRLVFAEALGAAHPALAAALGDPCGAGGPPPPELAVDGPVDAVSVAGREREALAMAGSLLAALIDMENVMPSQSCDGQLLESLPAFPAFLRAEDSSLSDLSQAQLREVYFSLHSLAAHLHVMAGDWQIGAGCDTFPERIVPKINTAVRSLRLNMCTLLTSSSIDPLSAPFPPPAMGERHAAAMQQQVYRYLDCSGRAARDCIVTNHAKRVLTHFSAKLAAALD